MQYDRDTETETETEAFNASSAFAKETTLELVEADDGRLVLRQADGDHASLMTIDFSDKIKDMLGDDAHNIGQHMIHAAVQVIMEKQISQWHANVYDQEPTHYS